MHERPGVTVRQKVRLPAKNNDKRSRQIYVLVLGHLTGYPRMLAIECKNYRMAKAEQRGVLRSSSSQVLTP